MKRIKKFVALALAATMMVAPASNVFAAKKAAQTGSTKPSVTVSTVGYKVRIPMIKENGKWKIDPLYAYIGIKNIKFDSVITDCKWNNPKKIDFDFNSKYAPYAILIKQKGLIIPRADNINRTPDIKLEFWVYGKRQKNLYSAHEVNLLFVKRTSPVQFAILGKDNYGDGAAQFVNPENYIFTEKFATSNSYTWMRPRHFHFRTVLIRATAGNKIKKIVAVGKDGHNFVFKSGSKVDLSKLKAIQVRYEVKRDSTNPYYAYLKKDVGVPALGVLTLNIK
jgi:hypothetical protein